MLFEMTMKVLQSRIYAVVTKQTYYIEPINALFFHKIVNMYVAYQSLCQISI